MTAVTTSCPHFVSKSSQVVLVKTLESHRDCCSYTPKKHDGVPLQIRRERGREREKKREAGCATVLICDGELYLASQQLLLECIDDSRTIFLLYRNSNLPNLPFFSRMAQPVGFGSEQTALLGTSGINNADLIDEDDYLGMRGSRSASSSPFSSLFMKKVILFTLSAVAALICYVIRYAWTHEPVSCA